MATAAHALAGVGLVAGEKGVGRRRAAAAAAGHAAVLADVARRMPLTFLEQVCKCVSQSRGTTVCVCVWCPLTNAKTSACSGH